MFNFFKNHKKIIMLLAIVATFGLARAALAANSTCDNGFIVLQVPIPGLGWCVKGFPEYLQAIYNLFVGISGILAVVMMMFGGFQWLIAGGNPTKISGAKTQILSAMAGLTLVLSSYIILNLINPKLTVLSLNPKSVDKSVWVGGDNFCVSGLKFTPKNNEKKPNCGIVYNISAGDSCYGAGCKEDEVCQNRSSSGVVALCASNVVLENQPGYGYEDKTTGSQNSIWTVADEGYISAPRTRTTLYCGKLYYRLLGTGDDGEKLVGSFCDGEKSCVIKLNNGIVLSKKASEASAYKFEEVGLIKTRNCY